MMGLDTLQRHLHLLEDFLQKSKGDFKHFKNSTDYYLRGIDSARKILNGEVVSFVYEVYSEKASNEVEIEKARRKKVIYLSSSKVVPLGTEILSLESDLGFILKIISDDSYQDDILSNESFDVIVSNMNLDQLKKIIPTNKLKTPLIHIVDNLETSQLDPQIYQILNQTTDNKKRIYYALRSAFKASDGIELFDRAKGLLMYMYSDLEEYLISKNKNEIQKTLNYEIKNFIKMYSSK